MSPLTGSAPIHPRWSEHHRPVASGSHTGRCTITRQGSGEGTTDPDGTWHPPTATTVYTGPCRITAPAPSSIVVVGEQQTAVATYEVGIEWDAAEVLEHDLITMDEAPDPAIVGKQLIVIDIAYATERFERVLRAKLNLSEPEA
ncbi:DUF6093 family protein [Nonomuraea sp. WAC 01424]|uniref:DUF6093 family protein n=1 Tax=Nonomuraea sp. WAC 01424 TaxID=2203200 RepID=UPI001C8B341B|nr:DUF6093 family protein [Nonomuraea sp. WAC 01424]